MQADWIIENARVLTMQPGAVRAEAVAVGGNRILGVGSRADLASFRAAHTRVVDAAGASVIPGIVESHLHLFGGAVEMAGLALGGLDTPSLVAAIRAEAARDPAARLVVGLGVGPLCLGQPITRQALDAILPDRPLALVCFDHHTIWANTAALVAAHLLQGAELTPGNEIVMGSDNLATGELREAAAFAPVLALTPTAGREWLGMVTGADPVPAATAAERAIDAQVLRRGLDYCASLGITSLQNMDGNWYQLELLAALQDQGALHSRVEIPFHHKNYFDTARVDEACEMRARYNSPFLRSGRIKIFMDGVLESLTALMLDDYPGHPGVRGAPLFTAAQFNEVAVRADGHGLQISVHAIGDGGVRRTLDGFAAARAAHGPRDSRHRIEHIEVIDPADLPRLGQLGVVASLQPIVAITVPGNPTEPTASRLGTKLPFGYAWATIRATGAQVAFSSDWPVSPLDPFLGMQAAMTARPLAPDCPRQAQSLIETLDAYTRAGAYAEFGEGQKGRLAPGLLADLVVLDADLEATAPDRIGQVKPVLTLCDGQVTYQR